MSRAVRARRIAAAAAFGGGGIGAMGAAFFGLLMTEVRFARRMIGTPFGTAGPGGAGRYGTGSGEAVHMAMIGDSSAVGLGAESPGQTVGVVIANALAAISGRPVVLHQHAVVGAESSHLEVQVSRLLEEIKDPDVVVIMVGANDVTHRIRPSVAVRYVDSAVRRLREAGAQVVVGTCPDLGTIEPIPYPLRAIARRWSRQLAAAQTIAVVEAGGRSVSLGDLLGPEFAARPKELFSSDGFHPSGAGYARAAAALFPSVASSLGCWPDDSERRPELHHEDRIDDIANAAVQAVDAAGTEVAGVEVSGSPRGPAGRWAMLRRRRPEDAREHERIDPAAEAAVEAAISAAVPGDGPEVVASATDGHRAFN